MRSRLPFAVLGLLTLAGACSADTGLTAGGSADVPVSFSVAALAGVSPGAPASSRAASGAGRFSPSSSANSDIVLDGGARGTVRVTSLQVALSNIRLRSVSPCASGTDSLPAERRDDDGCRTIVVPAQMLDVPLDGTTKVSLSAKVPAGTYSALRAVLRPVSQKDTALLAAYPSFAGRTVHVAGTYTDSAGVATPFTFNLNFSGEIELAFSAPITVDSSLGNLTFGVDVNSWFRNSTGALLNPTVLADRQGIEVRAKASFKAFKDSGRRGTDDNAESGRR